MLEEEIKSTGDVDGVTGIVQSALWLGAPNFTHNSWIQCGTRLETLSQLGRRMLVSSLLTLPKSKVSVKNQHLDNGIFERFVQTPVRYLLLAGIAANPDSRAIGLTKDPQLISDEKFATSLGMTFSMKERFEFSDKDKRTAIQIGLLLFYQNMIFKKPEIWHLCKLSLDKKLVSSLNHVALKNASIHTPALESFWVQIDNYVNTK